jgi:hypothetical protein
LRLDKSAVSQTRLNVDDKVRSNLFPWSGQFSPQLVQTFLEHYGAGSEKVLDPFVGSGTVLVEAARLGLAAAGSEINPAAYTMARTYRLAMLNPIERRSIVYELDNRFESLFPDDNDRLFLSNEESDTHSNVKARLLEWRECERRENHRQIIEVLIVLSDFCRNDVDARLRGTWHRLKRLVAQLPFTTKPIDVTNSDARNLPLEDDSIDLVVSSPPYINVFNYHQQYRASAEALGWHPLHAARSELGANRKHRQNRFLTVTQYCLDMAQVFAELRRVSRASARLIMVVGRESNVLRTQFYNGDIVARIGTRCAGLRAEKRQERVFQNKFGVKIYEDILHFRVPTEKVPKGEDPRNIAEEILRAAMEYAPPKSMSDLKDAYRRINQVRPSIVYAPKGFDGKSRENEPANTAS